ncbi:hypothetical protein [uncultured Tateyamaria sp.]|nr:hypothetical protein [uncultured Tateyamaria sp.]
MRKPFVFFTGLKLTIDQQINARRVRNERCQISAACTPDNDTGSII